MKPAAPKSEDDWLTDGVGLLLCCVLIGAAILEYLYG